MEIWIRPKYIGESTGFRILEKPLESAGFKFEFKLCHIPIDWLSTFIFLHVVPGLAVTPVETLTS